MVECATLHSFNRFIVPLMRTDPIWRTIGAEEAKRRGYAAINKEKGGI